MEGIARILAKYNVLSNYRENGKSQMHNLYCLYNTERREADPSARAYFNYKFKQYISNRQIIYDIIP